MTSPVFIIAEKEFGDAVRSKRLWGMTIVLVALFALMVFSLSIQATLQSDASQQQIVILDPLSKILVSLSSAISFVAPLLGLSLGYDAISGEREKGTMKFLLVRPVFRDQLINGKALGALITISFSLGLSGLILIGFSSAFLGATLDPDIVLRLIIYLLLSILLSMSYYSISLIFSAKFEKSSRSLLLSIAVWALFTFVIPLIAFLFVLSVLGPPPPPQSGEFEEWLMKSSEIQSFIVFATPNHHFSRVADSILLARAAMESRGLGIPEIPETIAEVVTYNWASIIMLILFFAVPYLISYAIFVSAEKE